MDAAAATPIEIASSPELEAASEPFVGQWNRLVSTTNWEKGRIICQWRDSLVAADSSAADYSDDTWSRLVGGVTGQHVGRLRRTFQRFGGTFKKYRGLFWSHFQSAIDWDDAEMWLEGAVHSKWSVADMRRTRWETLGGGEDTRPRDEQVVSSETDEDFVRSGEMAKSPDAKSGKLTDAGSRPLSEGPDFGDETEYAGPDSRDRAATEPAAVFRPFEHMPELPNDLAEAFDSFKLAILHHKTDGWKQISCDAVLESLNALKALALAPSDNPAPF